MGAKENMPAPAIAPPLVILICIAGAIVLVVIVAAMYRICRQSRVDADDDFEGKGWNPNKRNKDQDTYMEEVRYRNNAIAWEAANITDRQAYRRGWFREHIEEQRAHDQPGWTPVSLQRGTNESGGTYPYHGEAVSAEEYLSHVKDNPYQDLLKHKAREAQTHDRSSRISPARHFEQIHLSSDGPRTSDDRKLMTHNVPQEVEQLQQSPSGTGVKIIVNDESEDIVDADFLSNNKFAPRQSRMFRSSSIYSGDGLLPSNHLHLVQSSSNYALRNEQLIGMAVGMQEPEQKGIAL